MAQRIVTVKELAAEVYEHGQYLKRSFSADELKDEPDSTPGTDCRLQLHDGSWSFHTGDSSFDQDHRGSWGAGFVPRGCTKDEARSIAKDLIDEAMGDYDESEA